MGENVNGKNILRNVDEILRNRDINLMSKETYNFINLHCGTIAHYDRDGWCNRYSDLRDFVDLFLVRNEYGENLSELILTPRFHEPDLAPVVPVIEGIIDLCRRYRDEIFRIYDEAEVKVREALIRRLQNGEIHIRIHELEDP